MCGRYVSGEMSWKEYHDWLEGIAPPPARENDDRRRRYNIAPTTPAPICFLHGGQRHLELARWGLIPHWWTKPLAEMKLSTFNARSEEVAGKPFYRDALRRNRCLIPALGYYEWQTSGKDKQPYFIRAETNAPGICFAGLWSHVTLPDFSGLTFTMLTRPASDPIAHIHSRQPMILDETGHADWLAGADLDKTAQIDPDRLRFHRVGKAVGNTRNEGPELIEPFEG